MSKKEEVKKQAAPVDDMSVLLTALIALLAANRVADHRLGNEQPSPQLGKVDAATAARERATDAKLADAERAVKQSKAEVRAAIAKVDEAEYNLRDVKELSNFQI